jgi:hypothetical protein
LPAFLRGVLVTNKSGEAMHTYGYDAKTATLVSVIGGPSRDQDFEEFIRMSLILDTDGQQSKQRTAHLLVLEDSYPRPSATSRRKLADALRKFQVKEPLFAVATKSQMVRGLLTVMNWIAPQVHEIEIFATPEEGILWIEEQRHEKLPVLGALLAESREAFSKVG